MEVPRLTADAPAASPALLSPLLASLEPKQPWLVPFRQTWAEVHAAGATGEQRDTRNTHETGSLADERWRSGLTAVARTRDVRTRAGHRVEFVDPADAGATAYEAHIAATGRVPTRPNLHDFFNALAWLVFPRTKAALNARQAEAIARDGIGARRGPVRDAATLIDESGLLLAARDADVFDALDARRWRALLVERRERWQRDIVPLVLGHALLEKLTGPYKAVTAAVVCVQWQSDRTVDDPSTDVAWVDAVAATWVMRPDLAPAQLLHLPVLGIPGWWPANEAPGFYDDEQVFRPAR